MPTAPQPTTVRQPGPALARAIFCSLAALLPLVYVVAAVLGEGSQNLAARALAYIPRYLYRFCADTFQPFLELGTRLAVYLTQHWILTGCLIICAALVQTTTVATMAICAQVTLANRVAISFFGCNALVLSFVVPKVSQVGVLAVMCTLWLLNDCAAFAWHDNTTLPTYIVEKVALFYDTLPYYHYHKNAAVKPLDSPTLSKAEEGRRPHQQQLSSGTSP
ncbi:hypothetical protein JCM10049v2_001732 [Rhodotorula toruloides]